MVQFYQNRSIRGGEHHEQYRLLTQPGGTQVIEYEWRRSGAYGDEIGSGQIRISVTEFLAGDYDENAKSALIAHLKNASSPNS